MAALLAFSAEASPVRALTLIVQYGAYLILVAYLMTVITAAAWTWRGRRPFPLLVLSLGLVVTGSILVETFRPFPPAPVSWVVLAAGASLGVAVVVAVVPATSRRLAGSELLRVGRGGAGAWCGPRAGRP